MLYRFISRDINFHVFFLGGGSCRYPAVVGGDFCKCQHPLAGLVRTIRWESQMGGPRDGLLLGIPIGENSKPLIWLGNIYIYTYLFNALFITILQPTRNFHCLLFFVNLLCDMVLLKMVLVH